MATNLPYNDSVFLFRLQALIIDGGTEVVRNIFNNRLNNQPLVTFLTNEKATINCLRVKNTITKVQYDKLFPPGGQKPDSEDFDITLLMCLLRNIPSLGLNMSYPWHIPPAQSDTSTEADLIRLRTFRNEIAHASSTHCLDEPKYKRQWNKVEQCIQRLNSGPHSDPHLQATIDSFKTSPLDTATIQRLDKQWQELEKCLESEITTIKEDIIYTRKNIGENFLESEINLIAEDMRYTITNIGEVTGDTGEDDKVMEDVCEMKGHIERIVRRVDNLEEQAQNRDTKLSFKKPRREDGSVEENAQKEGSGSINDCRRIIAKGYTTLVNYIKPDPLLDCAEEFKLFDYRTVRDLKEEKNNRSDRNRNILEKVRQRGVAGLKKFKECLENSRQTKIAEFINRIEKGMDTDEIKSQIAEEATSLDELQEVLIETYRSDHSEMNLAPLLNKRTPLLQFYQMPDLEHVTENIELGRAAKEERTPIDTWEKLFHDSNQSNYRSIYICADAGLGKTAFSKYLARAWCQSKKQLQEESQFFKPEQLEAIGKFRFVFLLFLRESQKSNSCHLKDMIWEQLVSKLICSYGIKNLENILRNEKCLIILDGLDEWMHPPTCGKSEQVPYWSKRENVAVITTTRPWKFSVAGLKSGQTDHRIELTGLNQASANKLKYSCLSYFNMEHLVEKFTRTVSDKHATQLESVPLMLMYMLFLYMYGFNLGETKCDLYCQIIELLLSRTFEEKQELITSTTETIPHCFNKLKHCLKFYNPYLKPLGELAFKTLLEEKREENTLVFDSSVAIKCLGEECFNLCLKTGIISQSKCVQTHPLIQESTVSFSHKTMQEFFAALHMYSAPDDTRMSQLVLSKCRNVQDILDMSKIIMFISGMNVNVAALISHGMMKIINEDEVTQKYRNTTKSTESWGKPLKDLQNMFVSCCKEVRCASGDNLYIQDVFIDRDCEYEHYRVNLKQLIQNNRHNIKSIYIGNYRILLPPFKSEQRFVEYFELKDLKNLMKISWPNWQYTENIIPLFNTQVKCLEFGHSTWPILKHGSWSRSLFEKVTSLQKLEVIFINGFKFSHRELKLLYNFISQKVDMRQITLEDLICSEHKRRFFFEREESSCSDLSLDLSKHSQLRKLKLHLIPELNINMTPLKWCSLEKLYLPSLVFTRGTCDTINSELNKSDVNLFMVTTPASGLKDLVTVMHTLPHTVCVHMVSCSIEPESEWQTLKQQIKTSSHFTVLIDEEEDSLVFDEDEYDWEELEKFVFETIKLGN